ncbi:MAG: putative lipid II flippase FtsW [Pseudomonadota bacterium]
MSSSATAQQVSTTPGMEIDSRLMLTFGGLLLIGLVMVASASISIADRDMGEPMYYLYRQIAFAGVGLFGLSLMMILPTSIWQKLDYLWLLFAFVLLILVLIPGLGREVNGSTRWLRLGFFGLQVAEPARLLILIYLASYLVRHGDEVRNKFSGFIKPMLVVSFAVLLLLLQPDFGTSTVLLATTLGMLFIAGVRLRYFLSILAVVVAVMGYLAISSDYRLKRITGFLDPWSDAYASGYQLTQSLIAIGRGEWFGVGLGNSVQKLFYLPYAHTDCVFAVIAEEFGLFGVLIVLCLFCVLVWRAFDIGRLASKLGQSFHAYCAFGIGIWLGAQAFINIGVNMGVLPTKGLTLPLVSSGGSSLLVTCMAVGLLLRINGELLRPTVVTKSERSKS